jgi:hypothetical protein
MMMLLINFYYYKLFFPIFILLFISMSNPFNKPRTEYKQPSYIPPIIQTHNVPQPSEETIKQMFLLAEQGEISELFEYIKTNNLNLSYTNNSKSILDPIIRTNYIPDTEKKDYISRMINAKAPLISYDEENNTLLHLATKNQLKDVVDLLINKNCDIMKPNKYNQIPLHLLLQPEPIDEKTFDEYKKTYKKTAENAEEKKIIETEIDKMKSTISTNFETNQYISHIKNLIATSDQILKKELDDLKQQYSNEKAELQLNNLSTEQLHQKYFNSIVNLLSKYFINDSIPTDDPEKIFFTEYDKIINEEKKLLTKESSLLPIIGTIETTFNNIKKETQDILLLCKTYDDNNSIIQSSSSSSLLSSSATASPPPSSSIRSSLSQYNNQEETKSFLPPNQLGGNKLFNTILTTINTDFNQTNSFTSFDDNSTIYEDQTTQFDNKFPELTIVRNENQNQREEKGKKTKFPLSDDTVFDDIDFSFLTDNVYKFKNPQTLTDDENKIRNECLKFAKFYTGKGTYDDFSINPYKSIYDAVDDGSFFSNRTSTPSELSTAKQNIKKLLIYLLNNNIPCTEAQKIIRCILNYQTELDYQTRKNLQKILADIDDIYTTIYDDNYLQTVVTTMLNLDDAKYCQQNPSHKCDNQPDTVKYNKSPVSTILQYIIEIKKYETKIKKSVNYDDKLKYCYIIENILNKLKNKIIKATNFYKIVKEQLNNEPENQFNFYITVAQDKNNTILQYLNKINMSDLFGKLKEKCDNIIKLYENNLNKRLMDIIFYYNNKFVSDFKKLSHFIDNNNTSFDKKNSYTLNINTVKIHMNILEKILIDIILELNPSYAPIIPQLVHEILNIYIKTAINTFAQNYITANLQGGKIGNKQDRINQLIGGLNRKISEIMNNIYGLSPQIFTLTNKDSNPYYIDTSIIPLFTNKHKFIGLVKDYNGKTSIDMAIELLNVDAVRQIIDRIKTQELKDYNTKIGKIITDIDTDIKSADINDICEKLTIDDNIINKFMSDYQYLPQNLSENVPLENVFKIHVFTTLKNKKIIKNIDFNTNLYDQLLYQHIKIALQIFDNDDDPIKKMTLQQLYDNVITTISRNENDEKKKQDFLKTTVPEIKKNIDIITTEIKETKKKIDICLKYQHKKYKLLEIQKLF